MVHERRPSRPRIPALRMVGYIHPSLRAFDLSQFSMSRPLTSPQESPPRATAAVGLAGLRVAGSTLLLALGWAVTTTCASYQLYSDCVTPSSPCPDQGSQDQDAVLFLVGDAGSEEFESNPVLQHMKTAVTALDRRGVPATVVFLGDNVYEEGVRDGHPEDLRLLAGQVEVVAGTSAKGIFLPGNHDWGNTADDRGLERLMNQEQALAVFSGNGANVDLMPRAGCPGPERENLEDSRGDVLAALVLLDTPWWLLEAPGNSRCSPSTKEDVIREMERVLSEASGLLSTEPSSMASPRRLAGVHHPSYTWPGTIIRSRSSRNPRKVPPSSTSFPAVAARSPVQGPLPVAGSPRGYPDTCASISGPAAGSSSAWLRSARWRRLMRISVVGWMRAASRVSIGHASVENPQNGRPVSM